MPAGLWTLLLDSADVRWAGPGGAAPPQIDSDGTARLALAPWSFVVFGSGTAAISITS
jgi:hypothetical protein